MTERSFRQEYLGIFLDDEHETTLQEIARVYHAHCDAYDAGVCTAQGKDGPLPATPCEYARVSRHARYQIEVLSQQYHVPREAIFRAIQRYSRSFSS